ncbi:MAG: hypothetical protein NC204_04245 [Candidatus Amulumruptor caecigallinarius]|nr:hypothetical protein [Candidatus Amulumruptor caecigallinarius]
MNSRTLRNTIIVMLLCLLGVAPAIYAQPAGSWKLHSTFSRTPRRVMATDNGFFLFVHQNFFNNGGYDHYYETATGALFYYDASNPDRGIRDIKQLANLSGRNIMTVNYNPMYKYLVVGYEDGVVDFVDKNFNVKTIDVLKGRKVPGAHDIQTINFDIDSPDAWICTKSGFLRIDGNSFSVKSFKDGLENMAFITTVGDKIIASFGNKLYQADKEANPGILSNFAEITDFSLDYEPQPGSVMPLGKNSFAFITAKKNGSKDYTSFLKIVKKSGDNWTMSSANLETNTLLLQSQVSTTPLESTVIPTINGYLLHSETKARFLKFPENEESDPVITIVTLPAGTRYSATGDFESFWRWNDSAMVQSRIENGAWKDLTESLVPEAVFAAGSMKFDYSPTVGFIALNQGPDLKNRTSSIITAPFPATYRNGKWTDLSYYYNPPSLMTDDPFYTPTYTKYRNRFPACDPQGLLVDPLYPDYIYTASLWDGAVAMNLADTKKMPLLFISHTSSPFSGMPKKVTFPAQTWNSYTGAYLAGADADNNIWVMTDNAWNQDDSMTDHISFWCWTPEARKAALESCDVQKAGEWITMSLPVGASTPLSPYAIVLKHPNNKNKLISFIKGNYSVAIYDHKGTIADNSDDNVEIATRFVNEKGALLSFLYLDAFVEDPVTGDVVMCTETGPYLLNPNNPVSNNQIRVDRLCITDEYGNSTPVCPSATVVDACFDEYGRLWLGLLGGGLVGISADRSKIIAQQNTSNSIIPSDNIYGLGWNPETKSLFVSTENGLAEFFPDAPQTDNVADTSLPYAMPAKVDADFSGVVAVYNVGTSSRMLVRTTSGSIICELPMAKEGKTYWNLCDSDGALVKSGIYTISDANTDMKPLEIFVTR